MGDGSEHLEIRWIKPGTVTHELALHCALNAHAPPTSSAAAPEVTALLAKVHDGTLSIDLLLGAFHGEELICAALAAEPPGKAALVSIPVDLEPTGRYRAALSLLQTLQTMAWERSIVLLEALVAPGQLRVGHVLREAGFRYLTSLRYLRRDRAASGGGSTIAGDLEWVPYGPHWERLFQEAVEATYVESLDCPELTGLRPIADVLAGHRATGVFDSSLWWVARRGKEPVGVILLNQIPGAGALEVVYMGVAQAARGTGVAHALLDQAVAAAKRVGASTLALAVDQRNTPARRLYAGWGFIETGARDAWIATSVPTRV